MNRTEFIKAIEGLSNPNILIIGAMDLYSHDYIHRYIKPDWNIIFVEPILHHLNKIKQRLGDNYTYVNSAISDTNGTKEFIRFDEQTQSEQINIGMLGLTTVYPPKNCLKGFLNNGTHDDFIIREQLSCITVKKLLEEYEFILPIDYLQIDTEGHDWIILKQFDISNVKAIRYEWTSLSEDEYNESINFITQNGFKYCKDGEDIIGVKGDYE